MSKKAENSKKEEHYKLIQDAKEFYDKYEIETLPEGLRRNSMHHYYLSVYPGLQEMHPIEEHLRHPEKVSSMYVHLPFCSRICNFCSYFVKGVGNDKKQIDSYFGLLMQEFDNHLKDVNFDLDYIYFG